jgi:Domain of Unknown Function with PDB structure (DUF3857)
LFNVILALSFSGLTKSIENMKLLSQILLLLLLASVYSVNLLAGDEAWREVSQAELAMKSPKVEADADAEAIFWEVRIDDSSSSKLSKKHYVRVKIFTERGRENYSKIDIPYVKGIKIKDIAARVIRPDGSIVEIQKNEIFEREIVKTKKVKVKAKSFAIPNLEPGVIVEYRYQEVFDDSGAIGLELEFQRDIPIQTLSYYYKPYNKRKPIYQAYNFNDTNFVEDEKGYWVAKRTNIPSFKEEPMMPPLNNVRPWMQLQGVDINITNVRGGGFSTTFSISIKNPKIPLMYWGGVGAEHASLVEFMNKKSKEISKAAEQLISSASTDDEKLRKIYEFTQTQIKNSSFDPAITDDERAKLPRPKKVEDVLKYNVANSMFIDMLFGAMANSLGFETRIVLAPDRRKTFFDPNMTNEDFIQPRCIAVKVGKDWKFYNPGVSYLPYGKLVWYEEDVWALLVGENSNAWQKTPFTDEKTSVSLRNADAKITEDGTLEAKIRVEFSGQEALVYRLENYDKSVSKQEDDLKQEILNQIKTAEISNLAISNLSDTSKPIVYTYDLKVPNYAQKTGKRLFVQPGIFEFGNQPLFSAAERKYDVAFSYPWSEIDKIVIKLPEGFSLDNADAPSDIADPEKIGSLAIAMSIDKSKNILKYNRSFHFGRGGNLVFPVTAYKLVKNMFDEFHKANSHVITLKQN